MTHEEREAMGLARVAVHAHFHRGKSPTGYTYRDIGEALLLKIVRAALSVAGWRPIPAEVREGEAPWDEEFYETAKPGAAIPFVAAWDSEDGWCTFNRCYETTIQPVKGVPWRPTHWRRIVMPLPAPPEVG